MRWLTVAGVLLYLTRCNDAGALKCHPGSQDPLCALEKKEISPIQNLIERETAITSDETQCLPGSEWESNCHRCRCSESGFAVCTELDSCLSAELAEPISCKPNTNFKRDGNTCICLENGLALCTPRSHNIEKRSSEQECTPGTTLQRECNTCTCLSDGKLVCTKRGCVNWQSRKKREIPAALKPHSELRRKRSVCKPYSEFNVDCNPCKCAANGQSYTCTHNECLEGGNEKETNKEVEVFMETEGTDHIEQHSVCKPRGTFYVGCNTCRCNFQGTDYSCTNKPCPLPEDVELFHELKVPIPVTPNPSNSTRVVCVANRMFIKDCNTCWCNEDGTSYFCTRRVCLETPDDTVDPNEELKLRVVRKDCKPNEIFEMDCNMCRCNEDGTSYSCTRRACVEMDEKNATSRSVRAAAEQPKTCQPGQEFRMDCNKCLCNDEGQDFSCTRMDCAALNSNGGGADTFVTRRRRDTTARIEHDCIPGTMFKQDCHVCLCDTDGKHAACTLNDCRKDKDVTTEPSPSFRCTPGDQFRRDCNDCTCSADGKNIFCTLRLCDEVLGDITP